jgi:hypothetical protein
MSSVSMADPSNRIDLGQRLFLLGVFGIVVAEAVTTVVNVGQWFDWTSCLLGIVATLAILYLGNWLYTGDKTAYLATTAWVILFAGLSLAALLFRFQFESSGAAMGDAVSRHLGVNVAWQGILKLATYVLFAVVLFSGPTREWLATRRGEPVLSATNAATPLTGEPVELAAEHTTALTACASAMNTASAVLIGVGLIEILAALLSEGVAVIGFWEGFVLVGLGGGLSVPAKAINDLLAATPKNMGYVANVLQKLQSTFALYLIVALATLVVLRVATKSM